MRNEDLLTRTPTAEAVARETAKLPRPSEEARESLRRVLEAAARPATPAPWPALLQEARGKMDTRYAEPATSHRGGLAGLALVVSKRAFRRVFQPFINEALRKQVEFNESILDALATIHDVQREHVRTQALWRQEQERRLAALEAAARQPTPSAAQAGETPDTGAVAPEAAARTSPSGVSVAPTEAGSSPRASGRNGGGTARGRSRRR